VSDNWIILIPENPQLVPALERQQCAEARCRELAPHADEIVSHSSSSPRFYDCGTNLETISCPHCNAVLSLDWWRDAMDRDHAGDEFLMNAHDLPCCGKTATLNQLRYDWPQGIARYALELMNPVLGRLSPEVITEFEVILGCRLRVIYQHL